jgi:hypothetical protein
MAGKVTHTNLTPMWAVYNSVNLGFTNAGDITVTYTPEWRDYKAHQTGSYLLDSWAIGGDLTVQLTISETNHEGFWAMAFPLGEEQTATGPIDRFNFTKIADINASQFIGNVRASTLAAKLELIPVADYVSDTTETDNNFVIPKAFVRNNGDFMYSIEKSVEIPVTFQALLNPAGGAEGEAFAWVGKTTGTWTAGSGVAY